MRARAGVLGVVTGFGLACGGGDAGLQGTLKETEEVDLVVGIAAAD